MIFSMMMFSMLCLVLLLQAFSGIALVVLMLPATTRAALFDSFKAKLATASKGVLVVWQLVQW